MKQIKIGTIVGTISIVAFIVTIISLILITKNVWDNEKAKELYYAELYGLNEVNREIVNEPIKFPSQQYVMDEESDAYKAIAQLRVLHSQADYFLMGGRVDKYTPDATELWDKIIESSFLQRSEYELIRDSFTDDEDLTKDLNHLLALQKIAIEKRNSDAMKYMHRILHDLDLYGFPAKSATAKDYWGATYSVLSSDSAQLDEIVTFISKYTTQ